MVVNTLLALVKAITGVLGNSYALIADAIESVSDVAANLVVYFGVRIASSPPTEKHPYGKGRAETMATVVVSFALIVAAVVIARQSINEIRTPHLAPAPFTLVILAAVIITKELLFRTVLKEGSSIESSALKADAWHHRSDALTSAAVFVGISIALVGGPKYAAADDWGALFASFIIFINAIKLITPAIAELTDSSHEHGQMANEVRRVAATVNGVAGTHRCWVRKAGFDYFVDLDILVDGEISVRQGHDLAHEVQDKVRHAVPNITRVLVHVEPDDEFNRWTLDGKPQSQKNGC